MAIKSRFWFIMISKHMGACYSKHNFFFSRLRQRTWKESGNILYILLSHIHIKCFFFFFFFFFRIIIINDHDTLWYFMTEFINSISTTNSARSITISRCSDMVLSETICWRLYAMAWVWGFNETQAGISTPVEVLHLFTNSLKIRRYHVACTVCYPSVL